MQVLKEILAADPAIDARLPAPKVIEETDRIINLDEAFTLELPPIDTNLYDDVVLMFVDPDSSGADGPRGVVYQQAIDGRPTQGTVENGLLSPKFSRDQYAVVRGYVRQRQSGTWLRTPDSDQYEF